MICVSLLGWANTEDSVSFRILFFYSYWMYSSCWQIAGENSYFPCLEIVVPYMRTEIPNRLQDALFIFKGNLKTPAGLTLRLQYESEKVLENEWRLPSLAEGQTYYVVTTYSLFNLLRHDWRLQQNSISIHRSPSSSSSDEDHTLLTLVWD